MDMIVKKLISINKKEFNKLKRVSIFADKKFDFRITIF